VFWQNKSPPPVLGTKRSVAGVLGSCAPGSRALLRGEGADLLPRLLPGCCCCCCCCCFVCWRIIESNRIGGGGVCV
jgi:hypothetical protein